MRSINLNKFFIVFIFSLRASHIFVRGIPVFTAWFGCLGNVDCGLLGKGENVVFNTLGSRSVT